MQRTDQVIQSNNQSIKELKNSHMELKGLIQVNTQAIAKIEGQIGQIVSQLGEKEKINFSSPPMPNPKGQYVVGNFSGLIHG